MDHNRYNFNLPVEDEMFFGRVGLAETVLKNLTAPVGDSYGLVGGRRMGKTSLLRKLRRDLAAVQSDSAHALFPVPITFDFTGDVVTSVTDFFEQIALNIEDEIFDTLDAEPEKPIELRKRGNAGPALVRCIQQWAKFVSAQTDKRLRIILLLDECERIVKAPWSADLQSTLRYVLVNEKSMPHIKVVMAGSHGFRTTAMVKGSPLENILKYEHLANFRLEGTQALATRPHSLSVADDVIDALMSWSGGHPFLAQYILHELGERGFERLTVDEVARIARGFTTKRHDFKDWSNHLGEDVWDLFGVLLQAELPLSHAGWRQALGSIPSDFLQSVLGLVYHGLINFDDNAETFMPGGKMFSDWYQTQGSYPESGQSSENEFE